MSNRPELYFWVYYILLNSALMLPYYLTSDHKTTFWPFLRNDEPGHWRHIFKRYNRDIFRISGDLLWAMVASIYLPQLTLIFFLYFITALTFAVYSEIFNKLYGVANLYNDRKMILIGFTNYLYDLGGRQILHIIAFVTLITILYFCFTEAAEIGSTLQWNTPTKICLLVLLTISILFSFRYKFKYNGRMFIHFQFFRIFRNLLDSHKTYKTLQRFRAKSLDKLNEEVAINLDEKPNIILIFIESYGNLALEDQKITDKLISFSSDILQYGWHSSSALSISPTTGGKSWLAYSSFLHGFNITDDILYQYLISSDDFNSNYSFTKSLQNRGYKNYRISSIKSREDFNLEHYSKLNSVDEWISYDNLEFDGELYGFGPSIPDQFALNFGLEYVRNQCQKQPYSLFFITQDSHYPFATPPFLSDWKTHNTPTDKKHVSQLFQKTTVSAYNKSILSELNIMQDIIQRSQNQNDIFILIGDHQPPVLESKDYLTPLHIISKNQKFVESFEQYGLARGMTPNNKVEIYHQGIKSMISRELSKHYGKNLNPLPTYYPLGLEF